MVEQGWFGSQDYSSASRHGAKEKPELLEDCGMKTGGGMGNCEL
jgi:hypothetical protein